MIAKFAFGLGNSVFSELKNWICVKRYNVAQAKNVDDRYRSNADGFNKTGLRGKSNLESVHFHAFSFIYFSIKTVDERLQQPR